MTRDDLQMLVEQCGGDRQSLRREIIAQLQSPSGQAALGEAPPWLRLKPVEEVADLLLMEVDFDGKKDPVSAQD